MRLATVLRTFALLSLIFMSACQGMSWAPYATNGYNGNGYGYNGYPQQNWGGNQNFAQNVRQPVPALGYNPRTKTCDVGSHGLWHSESAGGCYGYVEDYQQTEFLRLNPGYGYSGFSGFNPNGF